MKVARDVYMWLGSDHATTYAWFVVFVACALCLGLILGEVRVAGWNWRLVLAFIAELVAASMSGRKLAGRI